jgi:deoxyribodipyrimidine photo-lyase
VSTTIVWFRRDLRLADHPALLAAVERGHPVVPVYVHAPEEDGEWAPGAASRWWLHHSLAALDAALRAAGSRLIVRRGSSLDALRDLARDCGADAVHWHRRYEPASIARDTAVKSGLREDGLVAESWNGALLAEPWAVRNQSGGPFQVFTPFWKHVLAREDPPRPLSAPARIPAPAHWPVSEPLEALGLQPRIRWDATIAATWRPGEEGAQERLRRFIETALEGYRDRRDLPAVEGTSRLSPHLHFGELSPRQPWHAVAMAHERLGRTPAEWRHDKFLSELGWREFSHHLLYHFPHTPTAPLRAEFAAFPWRDDAAGLEAWRRGRTGVPLVDAGMRELWATGWMHNRVRMVVASFLVKNLRVHWLEGARWFWDTLVDADLANNTQGWQWTSGCGADAAPYFRVFNPESQAARFDPQQDYIRRWVPEVGTDAYPPPLVDLKASRADALAAYQRMRAT